MGARDKSTVVVSTGKLKREDYKRTKHDSAFSDWKVPSFSLYYSLNPKP